MWLKRKKKNIAFDDVVELSEMEADAIIASGSSGVMEKGSVTYDYGKNYQIKSTLNKLHGK